MTEGGSLLLDTHCHLVDYPDPEAIVSSLGSAGLAVIAMTAAPSVYARLRVRFQHAPRVRLALGAHPLHVADFPALEWRIFDRYVSEATYIGEIGLDFSSRGAPTRSAQERS